MLIDEKIKRIIGIAEEKSRIPKEEQWPIAFLKYPVQTETNEIFRDIEINLLPYLESHQLNLINTTDFVIKTAKKLNSPIGDQERLTTITLEIINNEDQEFLAIHNYNNLYNFDSSNGDCTNLTTKCFGYITAKYPNLPLYIVVDEDHNFYNVRGWTHYFILADTENNLKIDRDKYLSESFNHDDSKNIDLNNRIGVKIIDPTTGLIIDADLDNEYSFDGIYPAFNLKLESDETIQPAVLNNFLNNKHGYGRKLPLIRIKRENETDSIDLVWLGKEKKLSLIVNNKHKTTKDLIKELSLDFNQLSKDNKLLSSLIIFLNTGVEEGLLTD